MLLLQRILLPNPIKLRTLYIMWGYYDDINDHYWETDIKLDCFSFTATW